MLKHYLHSMILNLSVTLRSVLSNPVTGALFQKGLEMIVQNIEPDKGFNAQIIEYVQRPSAALKRMQETRIDRVIVAEIKTKQFLCIVSQPGIIK